MKEIVTVVSLSIPVPVMHKGGAWGAKKRQLPRQLEFESDKWIARN